MDFATAAAWLVSLGGFRDCPFDLGVAQNSLITPRIRTPKIFIIFRYGISHKLGGPNILILGNPQWWDVGLGAKP